MTVSEFKNNAAESSSQGRSSKRAFRSSAKDGAKSFGTQSSGAKAGALKKSQSRKSKPKKSVGSKRISKDLKKDSSLKQLLQLALVRAEKCELLEAKECYLEVFHEAKQQGDLRLMMEAVSGLLRLASEAMDEDQVQSLGSELDEMMESHPRQVPPMAWYCKAVIARHSGQAILAQRYVHRYLTGLRHELGVDDFHSNEGFARAWVLLVITLVQRGHLKRVHYLMNTLLARFEPKKFRGINGLLYLVMGNIHERENKLEQALSWYQRAHAAFLSEHSWYYHLYVLMAYARLARLQQNYSQAYWYLDLVEKAAVGPEFGLLLKEIQQERSRLEKDAVDLLIDSRQCVVETRAAGQVSLRKQYVLLHILEALSKAHRSSEHDRERGLSKAEIIENVWQEKYRPEAHDNKLYYNINRLRKLIEPDAHKPQYLLNWKEGYRLAPGLRVQFIGSASGTAPDAGTEKRKMGGEDHVE